MSADYLDLPQLLRARGTIQLPGSKSISNRVLLLAALADGATELYDLLVSDDTRRMLDALDRLGVRVEQFGETDFRVHGVGGRFPVSQADLFLGNAGTAFRPLTAVLALAGGEYRLSGVSRMHERPIGDLVDGLRQIGGRVRHLARDGYPPLAISPPEATRANRVRLRGDVSSQFISGLLIALPLRGVETTIEVLGDLISRPYVEITLATMARFGVTVVRDGWRAFSVPAGSVYRSPGTVHVEGDASSASYFLALGAIGGGPLRVTGVGSDSIQGDVRFADALQQMGARVSRGADWIESRSPADVREEGVRLHGIDLDCNHIPDAAMTLASAALFADGPTMLRNIASWRVKETDRLAAMARELRKLGALVDEGADFLRIVPPPGGLSPAAIDTYDDHRMAMSFSLAALGTPLRINDPQVVAKTFPDFFARLAELGDPVPVIAIDGSSASGKGTIAARVARALGWHYLDSGSLYRLTALAAWRAGASLDDEGRMAEIAAGLDAEFNGELIRLSGEDVSDAIRSEEISTAASRVAALPAVRTALLFRQRAFRRRPGLVADGRDMGSVVFPDAALKVFLTASLEVRALRRHKQLMGKGIAASIENLLLDLSARDERDSQRSVAPMQQGRDAELLDTTNLTIDTAVAQVLDWVKTAPKIG
ncbi:bifunctional 3-phosphoshikimate 1-carboxyvinyltransferase/cytidylate kinase [Accumulibacter sp.]|uniref:bifunctional 3-phosphoshikimate 1-carboxyvinyltransferase/cytidylate kinase n=1 Tax=Accumulibacter sp. TaxID=2053492 RepID=UPI0025D1026A|nr:bifunctional 3-phosphoshikimate 1-carboxyvinyltransferase/cytidylate kinase [Accumulibacter sp.]MCM8594389.1 bifunctional 3-phosphoshikimate 1-carboxyvinyltransferase/cytidylate kinase [Accumulibacter sp.]MCM8624975.1 bifunctional 3-phosphoshikimate 1-carboxyvinyltransferase/cytidylate kinase [Accumulibacter sp.]MDS4048534.1 bifunctional 3-phosphoshikimate 1-carboxyvinyltransferase/cytidylate kinase [Accumulibacter sp.]